MGHIQAASRASSALRIRSPEVAGPRTPRTKKSTLTGRVSARQSWKDLSRATLIAAPLRRCTFQDAVERSSAFGRTLMSGQVILYFDDQTDALRFALAAGSVMAGDGPKATDSLL